MHGGAGACLIDRAVVDKRVQRLPACRALRPRLPRVRLNQTWYSFVAFFVADSYYLHRGTTCRESRKRYFRSQLTPRPLTPPRGRHRRAVRCLAPVQAGVRLQCTITRMYHYQTDVNGLGKVSLPTLPADAQTFIALHSSPGGRCNPLRPGPQARVMKGAEAQTFRVGNNPTLCRADLYSVSGVEMGDDTDLTHDRSIGAPATCVGAPTLSRSATESTCGRDESSAFPFIKASELVTARCRTCCARPAMRRVTSVSCLGGQREEEEG